MLSKKNMIIYALFFFLLLNVFCTSSQARSYLINTQSSLTITSNNINLGTLMPDSEVATSEITIKYEYGRFARPEGFPIPSRKNPTTITLAIESMPTWCEVSLDVSEFEAPIGSFLQKGSINFNTTLTAKISETSVTAFSEGKIVLNATAVRNGNIKDSSTSIELTISPDFIPEINYSLSNKSLMLKTDEDGNLSLCVENSANSDIIVEITANISEDGIIELDFPSSRTVEVGEKEIIPISVKAYSTENESSKDINVELTLSYSPSNDPTIEYIVEDASLSFNVSVSDESDFIDLTPFVIGIVVVFIVLYFVFTLIVWRRRS